MFAPVPMFIPVESARLEDRVRRLEQALVLSLETLQTIVERLEGKFGPEFLGTDFKHLTAVGSDAELEGVLDNIEHLLAAGKNSTAVRELRDAFECTWDQAHHVIREWRSHSREQKLRWLRLTRYIKSFDPAEPR